jgi:hypothetical protein
VDVAKVDRDVAYVAISCTRMLQTFVPNVSVVFPDVSVFILMLHAFHTYVACVLSRCCIYFAMAFSSIFICFLQVFQTYVASVSAVFKCMLQMFHLDISNVD